MKIVDPEVRKKAWKLIHSHLKLKLNEEWLEIVDTAIFGDIKAALKLLDVAEKKIKEVCQRNREFMEEIRALEERYYSGIVNALIVGALLGAFAGGCVGAAIRGTAGAGVGAVAGVIVGAVLGFYQGGRKALHIAKKNK